MRAIQFKFNTGQKSVIPVQIGHLNSGLSNWKFSKSVISHEMMTNIWKKVQNGAENISIRRSMSFWLSVWRMWSKGKSIALVIKEHRLAELNS